MKRSIVSIMILLVSNFHVLAQDTISSIHISQKRAFFSRNLLVPATLITFGAIAEINFDPSLNAELFKERKTDNPYFKTSIDNYLQFSPIILAYGFDALGMKSKTDIRNRTAILLKSEFLMASSVFLIKSSVSEARPDKSADNSLPSGHTAQAFAAAAFLSEEFGKKYKWVPYLSYSLASTVGVLRIMNNKHYLSDVLIGAGIGILSTKISYWTHQYKWGKRQKKVPTF